VLRGRATSKNWCLAGPVSRPAQRGTCIDIRSRGCRTCRDAGVSVDGQETPAADETQAPAGAVVPRSGRL
jgi:hypothetical protein